MSELDVIVSTRKDAHAAAKNAYLVAGDGADNGRRMRILVEEWDDDRSVQQNRFYWGPCLTEISEQARIAGQRWTVDAWHELFRRQFLGFEIKKAHIAGKKRPVISRTLRSTAKLKVKAFSKYLDELQGFAAGELGVQFSVRNWQDYTG